MENINLLLSFNVKMLRTFLGISQVTLSEISGISRATIAAIEAGSVDIRLETLLAISKPLGVAPYLLIREWRGYFETDIINMLSQDDAINLKNMYKFGNYKCVVASIKDIFTSNINLEEFIELIQFIAFHDDEEEDVVFFKKVKNSINENLKYPNQLLKKARVGRPIELPEPWGSLANKLGGVNILTNALKTNRRNINNWVNGITPNKTAQAFIEQVFKENDVDPPKFINKNINDFDEMSEANIPTQQIAVKQTAEFLNR